jgi:hypothetical protein
MYALVPFSPKGLNGKGAHILMWGRFHSKFWHWRQNGLWQVLPVLRTLYAQPAVQAHLVSFQVMIDLQKLELENNIQSAFSSPEYIFHNSDHSTVLMSRHQSPVIWNGLKTDSSTAFE